MAISRRCISAMHLGDASRRYISAICAHLCSSSPSEIIRIYDALGGIFAAIRRGLCPSSGAPSGAGSAIFGGLLGVIRRGPMPNMARSPTAPSLRPLLLWHGSCCCSAVVVVAALLLWWRCYCRGAVVAVPVLAQQYNAKYPLQRRVSQQHERKEHEGVDELR